MTLQQAQELVDAELIIAQLDRKIEAWDAELCRHLPGSAGRAVQLARIAAMEDAVAIVRAAPRVREAT